MLDLTSIDIELIEKATEIIKKNFDYKNENHTVGAAIRCKNGKVYVGVNVYSVHGACAEMIAIGAAITAGEREFETIVAVRGRGEGGVLSPCGNCRQMLVDYCPEIDVIISSNEGLKKVKAKDLIPYAYNASN